MKRRRPVDRLAITADLWTQWMPEPHATPAPASALSAAELLEEVGRNGLDLLRKYRERK